MRSIYLGYVIVAGAKEIEVEGIEHAAPAESTGAGRALQLNRLNLAWTSEAKKKDMATSR